MKEIFVFHIQLADVAPAPWRRLEIRAEGTFWHLHCAIQDVMPWEDRHLHEFRFPTGDEEVRIGLPDDEELEGKGFVASWRTALRDWFIVVPTHCRYLYDFGDGWVHTVTFESRRAAESGVRYPRCTAGGRRCPPEDVGGPQGYSEFLEALADRRHEEHKAYREWVDGGWDPEDFRPERIVFSKPSIRLRRAGLV